MASKKIIVYRFDPDQDESPYMKTYDVETEKVSGQMLLDAIEHIRKYQDPSLSLRRSCGGGVCGSDGMNINGKNGLACMTSLDDLPEKIVLQPLPGFPVIRDLIVDMTDFFEHLNDLKPYITVADDQNPKKETLQSPAERAKLDGFYECILCACCSSSCPSYWWNPEKYAGPAALLRAARNSLDSRDVKKKERYAKLKGPFKMQRCRTIMNCTYVCPKGLNPTKAIEKLRQLVIRDSV